MIFKYLLYIRDIIYFIVLAVSDCIKNKRYWCPKKCGKSYKHKKNMRSHFLHECGIPPQFPCIFCTKNFRRNEHLKKHLALHKFIT